MFVGYFQILYLSNLNVTYGKIAKSSFAFMGQTHRFQTKFLVFFVYIVLVRGHYSLWLQNVKNEIFHQKTSNIWSTRES